MLPNRRRSLGVTCGYLKTLSLIATCGNGHRCEQLPSRGKYCALLLCE